MRQPLLRVEKILANHDDVFGGAAQAQTDALYRQPDRNARLVRAIFTVPALAMISRQWTLRNEAGHHGDTPMFWKKKPTVDHREPTRLEPLAVPKPTSSAERLNEVASTLAESLNGYSEAAYRAAKPEPDAELQAAYDKVEAARTLVTEGRIAYALGRCLPEHVKYWPSWIKRDDFEKYIGFAATDISATASKEEDGSRNIDIKTIDFTFNGGRYRMILRNLGSSFAPSDPYQFGDVELFAGDERVAKFDIKEDSSKEYSEWEFSDVRALKVGHWMQDVIDMATQIEASRRRNMDEFQDERAREAAREIDLG